MDKKKIALGVVLVLLVAAGSYWAYGRYGAPGESLIVATGTVEATSVELCTKVAGAIKTMSVQAGDNVQQGQLVAEISRNDLLAQRERDALGVQKAENMLADLVSGAREQELDEAAINVEMARINHDQATLDLERVEILFQESAIPRAELDKASARAELTKNQLAAAESRLSLLQSGNRPQQIKAAQAEVERNKAVLKATEAMLEDLNVYAPLDGQILTKNHQKGEFVPMGSSLYTMADLNNLWIKVYIPTDDLPHVKLGQKVQFTVTGVGTPFPGVVNEIASQGEFTPKTIQTQQERANVVFAVKIKVDQQDGLLKPGMPADVVFGRRDGRD